MVSSFHALYYCSRCLYTYRRFVYLSWLGDFFTKFLFSFLFRFWFPFSISPFLWWLHKSSHRTTDKCALEEYGKVTAKKNKEKQFGSYNKAKKRLTKPRRPALKKVDAAGNQQKTRSKKWKTKSERKYKRWLCK